MWWLTFILSNIALASLLGAAAWFVQSRLRRPALARMLWVLVLVKLVTPPLAGAQLPRSALPSPCALGTCGCELHATMFTAWGGVAPWGLLAIWSVGATVTAWNAWRRSSQLRRLLKHANPAPKRWQKHANRMAAQLSLRRTPAILMIPGRLPPMVVPGWRQPRMLLPAALADDLNARQRSALLTHELTHLKRRDHWVRMLELTVSIVYWWLPGFTAIRRRLRACEEACCDAAVVARLPKARRDYARLLLDVVDFVDPLPPRYTANATAMSAASDLERRLVDILSESPPRRAQWPARAFVIAVACAVLPFGLHYSADAQPIDVQAAAVQSAPTATVSSGPTEVSAIDSNALTAVNAFCCPSHP